MSAHSGLSIRELLDALRRRRRGFLGVVVLVTAVATLIGLESPRMYTAGATVVIEPRGNPINDEALQTPVADDSVDASIIQTQIRLVQSREIIGRAADKLGLLESSDAIVYNELELRPSGLEDALSVAAEWLHDEWLHEMWFVATGTAKDTVVEARLGSGGYREQAIDVLQKNTSIVQSGTSHVLSINYSSTDPGRAAEIANVIAKSYVEWQLEGKLSTADRADSWLTERVEELRGAVLESERAVEQYRVENDLVSDGTAASDVQILTVNLIDARAEWTAKDARLQLLRELREGGGSRATEVLSSPLMTTLREREFELLREEAQLSKEYGRQHPRMLQLEAEKLKLAERIDREVQNVINEQENEVAIALRRVRALQETIEEAQGRNNRTNRAKIRLRELERKATAVRSAYEKYLVHLTELQRQQQIIEPDARIISVAQVPLTPSSASPIQYATVGFTLSIMLGLTLAVVREQYDSSIRSSRQVEQNLDLSVLAMVPKVTRHQWKGRLHDYLINQPLSAYAEGVRRIYMRAKRNNSDQRATIALVTSSLPNEGKTSLAAALAVFGAQQQQRSLLVDLDLRHPSVCREFDVRPEAGEFSADILENMVHCDEATNVDILTMRKDQYNPTILLTSPQLIAVLQEARARYDWVVLDTPPVLGMTDATVLSSQADAVVLVVKWEQTKLDAALTAIERLRSEGGSNVVGVVLNQVDLKKHAYYRFGDEGQYYENYKKYYLS